ncbi:MAG TPA: hypothetical protein ENL03_00775 [Phycisphaerae bacterium]|nr:hypothetical protein [Phycisphaerae bacterium]
MAAWNWTEILVFCIPFALVLLGVLVLVGFRKTIRTRYRVSKTIKADPDINEWLLVFNWSRKVLYVPFIATSMIAAILTLIFVKETGQSGIDPHLIGGIWMGVFFLNFLIDEYEVSIKLILIFILIVVVMMLWLNILGWLGSFLETFKYLRISLSATAYFTFAGIMSVAVLVSWVRGLFYYVAITPNYMNLQLGPTETGEQISREDYSTRIDTGDFLERLMGFGRVVITFKDQRRQPLMLLVGRIGKVAQKLESIRGKLAFDRHQPRDDDS